MADQPVRTTRRQAMQIAGLIGGALVTFNTGFYFLSGLYFGDSSDVAVNGIRGAFAILTGTIGVASFLAALAPRLLGHGISAVLGVLAMVAGIEALAHELPGVMGITLLGVGALMPTLAWLSLHHSRSAWAFLISTAAVLGLVLFFGAPKVRGLLGVGLWTALIVPGLLTVSVIALAMLKAEYAERA